MAKDFTQILQDAKGYLTRKPTSDDPDNNRIMLLMAYRKLQILLEDPESPFCQSSPRREAIEKEASRIIERIDHRYGRCIALDWVGETDKEKFEAAAEQDLAEANRFLERGKTATQETGRIGREQWMTKAGWYFMSAATGYRLAGDDVKFKWVWRGQNDLIGKSAQKV